MQKTGFLFSQENSYLILWWLVLIGGFSLAWPRPFDDFKETLLYMGSGLFCLGQIWKLKTSFILRASPPVILFLIYLVLAVLGILSTKTARYEGLLALSRILLWAALVWSLSRCREETLMRVGRASALSAAVIAVVVSCFRDGVTLWGFPFPFVPPIGHVTYFGNFMSLHVPLAAYFLLKSKHIRGRILWALVSGLAIYGTWISGTRASLLGLIAGLLAGLVMTHRAGLLNWRRAGIAGAAFLILLGGLGLWSPFGFRRERLADRFLAPLEAILKKPVSKAMNYRWKGFQTSWDMVGERPLLGWGLGSYRFVFPEFAWRRYAPDEIDPGAWYYHPHNELFHQASEVGLPGLIVWIAFMTSLLFLGWGGRKEQTLLGLTGLIVAWTSWQWSTNYLFPLSRLMTALFLALVFKGIPEAGKAFKFHRGLPVLILLNAMVLLGAYEASLVAVRKGQTATTNEEGMTWSRRAFRLAPMAFDPLFVYGNALIVSDRFEETTRRIESLRQEFPYVPSVLYHTALLSKWQGKRDEARSLLEHALRNTPRFDAARDLLSEME